MGGEKAIVAAPVASVAGSPPHGRGKAVQCGCGGEVIGITPAWAGKSVSADINHVLARDHPRMGGEKNPVADQRNWIVGSPPHGRGKVALRLPILTSPGITPAWAGKSFYADV